MCLGLVALKLNFHCRSLNTLSENKITVFTYNMTFAHSTILIANNISNFHYLVNHCCDFYYYQFHSVNLWLFTGEYADSWVTRSERFLDRQDAQAHILSLGPFLLGLNNFVSQPWIQALKEVKLLEGNRSVYRN